MKWVLILHFILTNGQVLDVNTNYAFSSQQACEDAKPTVRYFIHLWPGEKSWEPLCMPSR
jgi:hypothetical protein